MDSATILHLNGINRAFYKTTAMSFDATRGGAWPGWIKLLEYLPEQENISVLDIGCGNGRFGVFLAKETAYNIQYIGFDNNSTLLEIAARSLIKYPNIRAKFANQDVVQSFNIAGQYDLVVLFGIIHHIPGYENRRHFLTKLATAVRRDGLLVFAVWRFYEFDRFKRRIVPWPHHLVGKVEKNDYLLDWRQGEIALRYCHHVDDDELETLVKASGFSVADSYRADGSTANMNQYVFLKNKTERCGGPCISGYTP